MKIRDAMISGAAGAIFLTGLHETARRIIPHAPRVDVLGMRAIAMSMRVVDATPPPRDQLYWLAMGGDLVSNSLYYSVVGLGDSKHIWRRGIILGAAAGLGAVLLPRPMGLGRQPNQQTPVTQILTFMWYFLGGIVAAATAKALESSTAS